MSENENDFKYYEYPDAVYKIIDDFLEYIHDKDQKGIDFHPHPTINRQAIDLMKKYEIVNFRSDDKINIHQSIVDMTPVGWAILRSGSAKEYVTSMQEREKQTALLTFEKLSYDVKNSRRINKTYWFTFTVAIISLCISIILLVLKIKEPVKQDSSTPVLQAKHDTLLKSPAKYQNPVLKKKSP
jgi:hypothetical protein